MRSRLGAIASAARSASTRSALDVHRRLWEVVPGLPPGQFVQPFLWRSNISGMRRSNVLAFWNISKAYRKKGRCPGGPANVSNGLIAPGQPSAPPPTRGSPPVSLNRHSSRARTATVSFRSIVGFGAKHVIAPLLIADHVVGVIGRGILRRLIRPNAGRHCRDRPVDIAVAEEG
jgi:hypothetical protein